ncbi:MAG: hypothetical protein MJK04_24505, partial [Psychrosphaera sp.]|nr:hypothetical protein [Psychrosphaera sp.]
MNNRLLSLGLLLISAANSTTTNAQAAFTFEPANSAQLKRTGQEYVVSHYYPQENAKGNSKIDLVFAVTEWGTGTGSERQSMPTIIKRDENGWQMVKFNNEVFKHQYWVGVYDMPNQPYLWGFTDNSMEGPAHEVEVVFSQDNGISWTH